MDSVLGMILIFLALRGAWGIVEDIELFGRQWRLKK